MKMKVLEERSGVSRETIRFYIRKGLLPEPEKPKPNVAVYSEEHIQRLALIKQLQDERFLPLDVIKSLLDSQGTNELPDRMSLAGLEFALASRFGIKSTHRDIQHFLDDLNLSEEEVRTIADMGLIDLHEIEGRTSVSEQDSLVLKIWSQLKAAGFDNNLDYDVSILKRYQDAAAKVAREATMEFFSHVSNRKTADEAARMGETGVVLVNELFSLLHNKAIVHEVARENARQVSSSQDEQEVSKDTETSKKSA